jgi:Holliday junction resolvasome RuvABC endonuclease subunit
MVTYLGLDIATTTGWAFFEDDRLIDKGSIIIIPQMDLPQKLHYFHLELKNLLLRLRPHRIFIEDVILGISGAKTLSYLARLSGVAINASFEMVQERVKLYGPTHWKSNSFAGLSGMAKKWEVQLAVIRNYNLPVTGNFSEITKVLEEKVKIEEQLRTEWDVMRNRSNQIKSQMVRKRDPVSQDEKIYLDQQLKDVSKAILNIKRVLKEKEKEYDKKFSKISIDLAAQTGMTENICDACGVAYCGYKETIQNAT